MNVTTLGPRPPAWAFCRAVCGLYFVILVIPGMLMLFILPVLAMVTQRLPGGKDQDPYWSITRWLGIANTPLRLAAWLEQRYCQSDAQ